MENKQEILQELLSIGPDIAGVQAVNPFTVPVGYFAAFPELMLEKIRIESLLQHAPLNIYSVPEGYFEGLSANIIERTQNISEDHKEVKTELAEVAPLLNTIGRENVYTVPLGYFAELDPAAAITIQQPVTKLVTMRKARKWMQFAAAAVMAGVLVTGAFLYTDDNGDDAVNTPSSELSLEKVSEADLVKYMDNPEHLIAAPATTSLASETELADVKNNIRQVSDEELNQYIKENGESFDSAASEKEE